VTGLALCIGIILDTISGDHGQMNCLFGIRLRDKCVDLVPKIFCIRSIDYCTHKCDFTCHMSMIIFATKQIQSDQNHSQKTLKMGQHAPE